MIHNNINDRPIGVFDSGIGGLTVLREIISYLPYEEVVYLGDTARVPYGTRSPVTVIKYGLQNVDFLVRQGIKALVVACNTVSAVGIDELQKKLPIPVIGVIGPGANAAAAAVSEKGRIGVIGTETTINSGAYQRALSEVKPGVEIVTKSCGLFVPLVEEGWTNGRIARAVIDKYLEPLKREGVDALVLGCTHYPLLKERIGGFMGSKTVLIDSAIETAKEIKRLLVKKGLLGTKKEDAPKRFFVTDSPEKFKKVGERFLGGEIEDITLVDINAP